MQLVVAGGTLALLLAVWVGARLCRIYAPRLPGVRLDAAAACLVDEAADGGGLRLFACVPTPEGGPPSAVPPPELGAALVLEVAAPGDARHIATLTVAAQRRDGRTVLRTESWDVADAIAAVLLHLRDRTGLTPSVHFCWPDRHPLAQWLQFLLLGTGQTVLLTRHLLQEAEPDPDRRPIVFVS
ncbi:hypothetical protein [Dactylosporangium siamense]|uniref:Uncharacterized protein n=1 Tax=Dactylosporangium siamense TaxID=685454 RepID=A0A919PXK6_9ACTN|nr:hypothetical protein [Dactylosporangium siamense]GIG52635.1 hypothetical protein Dsi01nite_106760 [Dactylosporangium siamense]